MNLIIRSALARKTVSLIFAGVRVSKVGIANLRRHIDRTRYARLESLIARHEAEMREGAFIEEANAKIRAFVANPPFPFGDEELEDFAWGLVVEAGLNKDHATCWVSSYGDQRIEIVRYR